MICPHQGVKKADAAPDALKNDLPEFKVAIQYKLLMLSVITSILFFG